MPDFVRVESAGKEIFLVGTAHVSRKSVDLVKKVIDDVKPDAVAVELCGQRRAALVEGKKWDDTEITKVIKSGRTYLFLAQLFLSNYQRRIGDRLGIKPGMEMLEAIKIAEESKIPVFLVDRDINVTLRRAVRRMSLMEKAKLLGAMLSGSFSDEVSEEDVERLKREDILTELMNELSKEIPSVKEVLVDERNSYIANRILSLDARRIVAVVGAGHVEGIGEEIKKGRREIGELKEVPAGRGKLKYVAYLVPLIFLMIVGWGFLKHDTAFTFRIFALWFLINGTLSALGVILALGHPLSVISAFLAAPFTSLNPTIAAGWVAGLVELSIRKPRVVDFEKMLKLNNWRDYWHNRITRVLLVIVFANIGSSIGTFVALPYLLSLI